MVLPRSCPAALSPENIAQTVGNERLEKIMIAYNNSRKRGDCDSCKAELNNPDNSIFEQKIQNDIQAIRDAGTEIKCEACDDVGKYINAVLTGDMNTITELENKYTS